MDKLFAMLAGDLARAAAVSLGSVLVSHGLLSANNSHQFVELAVGGGVALGGLAWQWVRTSGHKMAHDLNVILQAKLDAAAAEAEKPTLDGKKVAAAVAQNIIK